MNLQHLCSATSAEVYFDNYNNWVYVDWVGELTLPTVQHTCLSIARCFLNHYYPRVLNSNAHVTSVTWDVSPWLASEFLPALTFTGVEQMAWVVPPGLRARNNVLTTVNLFPHVAISLFDEVENAVTWLQQTAPEDLQTGCPPLGRCYADEQKLHYLVEGLAQQLQAAPAPTGTTPTQLP
ncbi:MAG: hypothetical protein EOO56_14870 [Hymenobacter sp.]|nr:MAG: hypothetical protein EOO56_14870 [Hymenobacter sp.]